MMNEEAFPLTITFTFVDGLQMRVRVEQKKNTLVTQTDLQRDGRPVTELEDKLWRPVLLLPVAELVENLVKSAGDEKAAARLAKWREDYERVFYEKLHSPEKRVALTFLAAWQRETLLAAGQPPTPIKSNLSARYWMR